MKIKEAKENIMKNFRANYSSDIKTHDVSANAIEVFILNAMEQLENIVATNMEDKNKEVATQK